MLNQEHERIYNLNYNTVVAVYVRNSSRVRLVITLFSYRQVKQAGRIHSRRAVLSVKWLWSQALTQVELGSESISGKSVLKIIFIYYSLAISTLISSVCVCVGVCVSLCVYVCVYHAHKHVDLLIHVTMGGQVSSSTTLCLISVRHGLSLIQSSPFRLVRLVTLLYPRFLQVEITYLIHRRKT